MALAAGLIAPAGVLLVGWAMALAGWFASDGGAHGTTRSALRLASDAWLLAHGTHLDVAAVTVTASPLGLTALTAWLTYRTARWAGRRADDGPGAGSPPSSLLRSGLPRPERTRGGLDLTTWGLATAVLGATYATVAVLVAVLASVPAVQPHLAQAFLGGLGMGVLAGGPGLLAGTGQLRTLVLRVPRSARAVVLGAFATVLLLLAAGSLLAGVSLALHSGAAGEVFSALEPDTGDALVMTMLLLLASPNLAVLGATYLLGPGFAVGAGTVVAPSQVLLGPVPAVPALAALPATGPGPSWGWAFVVVPPVLAGLAALLVARVYPERSWWRGAARGLAGGVLAALLLAVLVWAAGGSVGPGRMAVTGASVPEVTGLALAALGLGGAVGGLVAALVRHVRVPVEDEPIDEPTEQVDLSAEHTVRIPLPRD